MEKSKFRLLPYGVILFLIVFIFVQRNCSAQNVKTVKQKVSLPEKKGDFKNATAIIKTEGKKDSIVWRDKIIKTDNPINKKLAQDFILSQKENDSLKTLKLYLNAIEEREDTYIFDNKDVKLEVYTKTRGEILKMTPKYTMKAREEVVEVKQKNTVFAIYAGGGLETTTTLERLTPKVNLGVQNKRGDILSLNYGITDKSIGLNYSLRILNIKK